MIGILLTSFLISMPVSAHPPESQEFRSKHTGVDFPVGYADLNSDSETVVRVIYPAMEDGENAAMAGNGPFPFTVYFGDEGEEIDDYGIISSEIVKRGTIVVVTNGFDSEDTTDVVSSLELLESIIIMMYQINSTNNIIGSAFGNIDICLLYTSDAADE